MIRLVSHSHRELAATGAGALHLFLEESARACGASEFLVRVHTGEGHIEPLHRVGDHFVDRIERCLCWADFFVVAEDDDAEVARVVVFDMGTLKLERASLPDASFGIDREVIPDVGPPVVEVPATDEIHPTQRVGIRPRRHRHDCVVVDGDPTDVGHRVGKPTLGCRARPFGASDDKRWDR